MQIRFLLGPAGSGKTFRCLREVRAELKSATEGPPLLLLAPKQSTYLLERQLLEDSNVAGYTRLHVLSLERLARFVFERLRVPPPELLDEEGRIMVLRGLLGRKREELELFRASARLTGFASQLSATLSELQRHQFTPEILRVLAGKLEKERALALKLRDLATLMEAYSAWLSDHALLDADRLLGVATAALESHLPTAAVPLQVDRVWVDGFAEWSPCELEFLASIARCSQQLTLTFCIDDSADSGSWLSPWNAMRQTCQDCFKRLEAIPGSNVILETLARSSEASRFQRSSAIAHLERHWAAPKPLIAPGQPAPCKEIRLIQCATPEAEVTFAAREIWRHVRAGGRFSEVSVITRELEIYHAELRRVFTNYEIPFFLDRRESVAHHPMAELTRSALRIAALNWKQNDVFAALKTGLAGAAELEVDRLENEALARGWEGNAWLEPPRVPNDPELASWLAELHPRVLAPLIRFVSDLKGLENGSNGGQLAALLRALWAALHVEETLQDWAASQGLDLHSNLHTSAHETVWDQINAWLVNVELAFASEELSLREWLPILDAGLASLTIGVVPPALDQVVVGQIDRSRNPEVRLAILLGLNEGVFPSRLPSSGLLTESERALLESQQLKVGGTARHHLSRERYLAYIACTRPRDRLVATRALQDADGNPLNESQFGLHLRQLFPGLSWEPDLPALDLERVEHPVELVVPMLRAATATALDWDQLITHPYLRETRVQLTQLRAADAVEELSPTIAQRLYGPKLRTSVSRLEQYAACPFRFFLHSGLRVEERQKFELDAREQGSFQHEVLARFHQELTKENRRWRDLDPKTAGERVRQIAEDLAGTYRDGLLQANARGRFMARMLGASLEIFVRTLVEWMHSQYTFDPVQVELGFGGDPQAPAWRVELADGRCLELYGRIDRIDLARDEITGRTMAVVVDYKSSHKQLEDIMMSNGLQLQLLAYLNVLQHWPHPEKVFGTTELYPAGVFYVNLRGHYTREHLRDAVLAKTEEARKLAYRHCGRFDTAALPWLDSRCKAPNGDQFNYRRKSGGGLYSNCREAVSNTRFRQLMESVTANLRRMGDEIYQGTIRVDPYRKGKKLACELCGYTAVCRIDPWTHSFRTLTMPAPGPNTAECAAR